MKNYIIYKAKWTWDIEDGIEKVLDTITAKDEYDAVNLFNSQIRFRRFNPFIHRVAEIKIIL
jgi:hypothetical protein